VTRLVSKHLTMILVKCGCFPGGLVLIYPSTDCGLIHFSPETAGEILNPLALAYFHVDAVFVEFLDYLLNVFFEVFVKVRFLFLCFRESLF